MNMDNVDATILNELQANARTPNSDIAKQLDMAPSAILERIRKLESRGIIRKYQAVLNHSTIDTALTAFVRVKTKGANWVEACSQQLNSINNVIEVHEITGEYAYLLKIRAKDMDHLSTILKDQIGKVEDVSVTNTTMVLKSRKENESFEIIPTKKPRKKKVNRKK